MQSTTKTILKKVIAEIKNPKLKDKFRSSSKDFTRKRKQEFSLTLLFLINFLKKSLSIEIENFVKLFNKQIKNKILSVFTKSAFVQCRNKIQPEVFTHLSSVILNEFYAHKKEVKLWKGFRLLSVDGSRLTLPDTKELRKIYGEAKNSEKQGTAQGRLSVLYDVLNGYVIDGVLAPLSKGESVLATEHLKCTNKGDLVVYDRGYPSFNLIYRHKKIEIQFLMRAKISFSKMTKTFYDSRKKSAVMEMFPGKNAKLSNKEYDKNTSIKVRLLRIELSSGETEILMTSLLNAKKYPHKLFKELYFERWKVETYYDELKNKLKIGYFSGYSNNSIQQDFKAALFVSNIQTLIVKEINEELVEKEGTKYTYKVNTNLSYGFMKDRIVELLFASTNFEETLDELKSLFKRHIIPIRPERKHTRDVGKFRNRMKPVVTKNSRDAF